MKTMTCNQLGGACELLFHGNNFEEIVAQSKQHGMEMFQQADQPHLDAMTAMKKVMQSAGEMQVWLDNKLRAFEALPKDP